MFAETASSNTARRNSIRYEFLGSNFGLRFHKPEAFCECQWRWPPPVYLTYRVVTFVYTVFALAEYIVKVKTLNWEHHVLVFMTTWTYILLTAYFLLGAISALLYFLHQRHFRHKPQSMALNSHLVPRTSGQREEPVLPSAGSKDSVPPGSDAAKISNRDSQADDLRGSETDPPEFSRCGVTGVSLSSATTNCSSRRDSQPHNPINVARDPHESSRSDFEGVSVVGDKTNHVTSVSPSAKALNSTCHEAGLSCYIQLFWLLGNIVQVWAIIVTIIFFGVLFPAKSDTFLYLHDVNVHALNTGFMLLEAMLGARPVRVLHVIYPILYGVAYTIFSVIYWSRDPNYNVIYKNVLDWNRPGLTVGVVCGLAFLGLPLLQLAFFAAFKLRLAVYRYVYEEDYFQD